MSLLNKEIEIEFREMIKETSDIYSFVFNRPKELSWIPGQHAIFRNLECKAEGDKNYRIFSVASIMEEEKVMFSTRITSESTECKKMLLNLKKGDKLSIEDPLGRFLITDYDKPIFLIVGGIGITPVRAFLMDMDLKSINPERLELLYADDRGEFAYEDSLKWLDKKYTGFHLHLISDRNDFMKKIEEYSKEMRNNALFYISGTPGMNAIITEKLLEMGVDKENIKTDNFIGY
ncbi:MAG: FAD-dependent oxidoreductase [Gudongella sp.]|nr:FAD-dependent oxidoreductase [Gudongella sp.]